MDLRVDSVRANYGVDSMIVDGNVSTMSIPCVRISHPTDPITPGAIWYEEIGWKGDDSVSAFIYVAFPSRFGLKAKYEIYWAPVSTTGGNTKDDRHWNGDYDKPTIAGSWGIDHFHCYIKNGVMELA